VVQDFPTRRGKEMLNFAIEERKSCDWRHRRSGSVGKVLIHGSFLAIGGCRSSFADAPRSAHRI